MSSLSKNDYKVLYLLYELGCTNDMKSLTISKISKDCSLSIPKVRVSVRYFKELEYIKEGIPQCSAKTYYITEQGLNKIGGMLI
jgi:DNA-binding transcriptional regulator GbsR (MarR family)